MNTRYADPASVASAARSFPATPSQAPSPSGLIRLAALFDRRSVVVRGLALLALSLGLLPLQAVAQSQCYVWTFPWNGTYYSTPQAACNNGGAANNSAPNVVGGTTTSTYLIGGHFGGSYSNGTEMLYCNLLLNITGTPSGCASSPGFCGTHLEPQGETNETLVTNPNTCGYYAAAPSPPMSEPPCPNCIGHPINPEMATVFDTEKDVAFVGGSATIAFSRFYNSSDSIGSDMGPGWRHSYDRSILSNTTIVKPTPYPGQSNIVSPIYLDPATACTSGFAYLQPQVNGWQGATASYANSICTVSSGSGTIATLQILSPEFPLPVSTPVEYDVIRDDGQILRYPVAGGTISNPPGITLRLAVTGSGYTLTDDNDAVETYNSAGALLSITTRAGVVQTLTYDTNGLWSGVGDSFGNALTVGRDAGSRITSVVVAGGGTTGFAYGGTNDVLTTVTNADSTTRTFLYENASFPFALTGQMDESNTRFATWGYDSQGRAKTTQEAGGVGLNTLTYNSDGTVTVNDPLGAVRTFTYTRIGDTERVTSISGSQCPTCSESAATTYDAAGWVASRTDYNGNVTCYANDPTRGLELVRVEGFAPGSTCPAGLATYTPASGTAQRKITTVWHATYRLPTTITEATRTTVNTYDPSGNLKTHKVTDTTVTPNVARTWTYTPDAFGRVLTADGPRTDVVDQTLYLYYPCTTGSQCGQINTIQDAVGNTTTFNTYNAYGQPTQVTDPNGIISTLGYDTRQRLTARCVNGTLPACTGGELTQFSYWPFGPLETATLPDGSSATYTYNGAHQLTQIVDGLGNKIVYTPDAVGNRTAENDYDPTSVLTRTHTSVFNTLGQLSQDVGAAGGPAVTTTYGYYPNGELHTINAPLARNTTNLYDALNRLHQVTDPAGGNTVFAYDANDNVLSVNDPRTIVDSYTYNGFGNTLTVALADVGTGVTTNTYDSGGNLATSVDNRGATTTYTYDAVNRVKTAAFKKGTITDQTITYSYDAGTHGKGRLTGASDANHSMTWGYDSEGRVNSKAQTVGGVIATVGYTYTNGDLTTLNTPSGQSVTYAYTNHQVTGITIGSTALLSSVAYEPFGPARGWTWGNGTTEVRLYNTDGNQSQISGPESTTYGYDNAFHITSIINASNSALSWGYGYDVMDRVNSASRTGTTQGFTYDLDGNRKTQTGTISGTYGVSPASNRLNSITGTPARTYTFDTDADVLTYANNTFIFNDRDRMASVSVSSVLTTYTYNALGQRVQKVGGPAGTVIFAYDEGGHLLGEYSSTGALVQETIWLGDTPVATLRPHSGGGIDIYYVHADHLNAPRTVTQSITNGKIVWRWDTDPFGSIAPNSNPNGLGTFSYNLRFPGQYADIETGLYYNYFRDYDPQTGRFIESDPIGLKAGVNTFAYGGGNPLGLVDPLGLTQCDIDTAKAIAMGAGLQIGTGQFLVYPEGYVMADLGYTDVGHRRIVGLTIPGVGTRLSNSYLQILTDEQAAELLDTLIHEAVHYTLPIKDPKQDDTIGTGYAYDEAKRLTTPPLVKRLNLQRKDCPCGTK